MAKQVQKIDKRKLKEAISRRDFIKTLGMAGTVGVAAGFGTFQGLRYVFGIKKSLAAAEKELRELTLDVKRLGGGLEKQLADETHELEKQYTDGRLRIYHELGIATPAELDNFERIIETSKEFERHYGFVERAKIFKDRIDRRLLKADAYFESLQPSTIKRFNNLLRKIGGKPSGKKGIDYRGVQRQRLETLCKIYDANEDNRVAEVQVLKKINEFLRDSNLPSDERELYNFLRDQYDNKDKSESKSRDLKEFITNYEKFGPRNEVFLRLRESLSNAEKIYGQIKENKDYIQQLQDLLKKGIALKQELRQKGVREFQDYNREFDKKADELRSSVDRIIRDLNVRGYDVETREEITRPVLTEWLARGASAVNYCVSTAVGGLAALATGKFMRRGSEARIANKALDNVCRRYAQLADDCEQLGEKIETLKKDGKSN